ncbi:hypothetical protein C8R47DRAFT_1316044 [Mycena vitilis]|nr:hypothetical protein C8R47DRAFT_1316044 [Mycena vitilis]
MSLPGTGALLIGTWLNSLLYTVEILQAAYYFRRFQNDSWVRKALVITACLVDALSMLANYACVYLATILDAGDPAYLARQYWPVPLYLFTTGLVAALVQVFLAVRYWKLSKNMVITMILFACNTLALGGAFSGAMTIARFPGFEDRGRDKVPATAWLVSEVVADACIAAALMWEFRKGKGAKRFGAQLVQSGAAGAVVTLVALVAYLLDHRSNVHLGIAWCLGRVYVLTMLANLNTRTTGERSEKNGAYSNEMLGQDAVTLGGGAEYDVHRMASTIQFLEQVESRQDVSSRSSLIPSVNVSSRSNMMPSVRSPSPDHTRPRLTSMNDSASIISNKKHDLFLARSLNRSRRVTLCV